MWFVWETGGGAAILRGHGSGSVVNQVRSNVRPPAPHCIALQIKGIGCVDVGNPPPPPERP